MKIYCDLDGVLVNFDKGYYNLTGIDIKNKYVEDIKFWEPINNAGADFWINLEWMDDGKYLWNYIKKYKPIILSKPSLDISSKIGKTFWTSFHLPPSTKLILTQKKEKYCRKGDILIDDMDDNIFLWKKVGGIGIKHINTQDTIKQLKNLNL